MRIVGILLAAGQGSRFGGDKLLAKLASGTPVGVQAARNLIAVIDEVIAVVRPDDEVLRQALAATGARVEPCPRAHEGMGASLAHGVQATRDADGWVVALGDMPNVQPATITRIREGLASGAEIVAPCFRGSRGHPVAFGRCHRDALCALGGDAGAREMLRTAHERIVLVDCDDPGVLADVDTPEALAKLS
jgi:molybdenum cofactor cytidylyltransferase